MPLSAVIRTICFLTITFLKFDDITRKEQLKLVFDFKNKNLPIELSSDINSHITRKKGASSSLKLKQLILGLNLSVTQQQFYGIILLKIMKSTTLPKLEYFKNTLKLLRLPIEGKLNLYPHVF